MTLCAASIITRIAHLPTAWLAAVVLVRQVRQGNPGYVSHPETRPKVRRW